MEALKWPSLRSRRDEHILKLVSKCMDGRCPQYFKNYFVFNKDICARSTRQSNLLQLSAMRTEVAWRSFSFTMKVRFLIVIVTAHNFGRSWARSIQPKFQLVRPGKVVHLKRWTRFSKLFRLDRTDPFSFGPKFPEILVEWIAPLVISSYVILPLYIFHYVSLFSS